MSYNKCKIFNEQATNLDTKKQSNIISFNETDTPTLIANTAKISNGQHSLFTNLMKQQRSIDLITTENEKSPSKSSTASSSQIDSLEITTASNIVNHSVNSKISCGSIKGYPYQNAYTSSVFQIDPIDQQRDKTFFLQDVPIHIQITGSEEEPSLVLLHTNVYTIKIKHSDYSWTIKRKYKQFLKLYEAYGLFKTKLNIRNAAVAAAHLTPSLYSTQTSVIIVDEAMSNKKFNTSDHFRLIFQSIASDLNHAKPILEKFLQDVLDHKLFRNHNETLKFLEVSHLSFIHDLGDKNKEGLIKKCTMNIHMCSSAFNFSFFWDNRWLIIKDTFVAYLDNKTGEIRSVLLVDHNFNVSSGYQATGEKHGLLIENLSKSIFVKCYNEKRALEWRMAIMKMIQGTGSLFRYQQRFNSFAPCRENSNVRWFVDGSDYMESIADSIESAKQEIFITGFFLSPEIYLKRPVIVGDRWRLDKLLQRKAEEGVKIYVLIYKEIEITLPSINSAYSKRILTLSHKNIKVLRHPDHINEPNQFFTIMWAHHEKLVIIDQSLAYFGGIDLCYGRWDNNEHKLTDLGSVLSSNSTVVTSLPDVNTVKKHPNNQAASCSFNNHSSQKNEILIKHNLSDENNNEDNLDDNNESNNRLNPLRNTRHKALRMVSSPAQSVEVVENTEQALNDQTLLSRNFLIDNMTDYYNNFIKKDIRIEDLRRNSRGSLDSDINSTCQENSFEGLLKKESRFDKIFKLKRSKSLDINTTTSSSLDLPEKNKDASNNPFKIIKDSLNNKRKSNHTSLKLFQREYKELSIFNKLKKIKQFKENLKRYALKTSKNQDSDSDEYNIEFSSHRSRKQKSESQNNDVTQFNKRDNNSLLEGSSKLWIGKDYCNFIFKDVVNVHSPFQDSIDRKVTPRMPWHDVAGCVCGPAARDIARHFIQRWNYIKTKKVRNDKSYIQLLPKAYKNYTIPPHILNRSPLCNVQALRSVSSWSAGVSKTESSIHTAMCHLISTAKHYVYIENQFFISSVEEGSVVRNDIAQCLYERIVKAHIQHENFKVYIFLPLIPGYAGEYGRSSGILLHTITHYNNASINGLIKKLAESSIDALNYIFFFGMRTWSVLNNNAITELIYVHSKLLIVDDRACIIGSANINDRSLLGNRDSEVALYIEDTQFVDGCLNKIPCKVGKFSSTLRLRLFKEFLGEISCHNESNFTSLFPANTTSLDRNVVLNNYNPPLNLTDPCSDEFYKKVLLKYAAQNTKIYDTVFKCIPCDFVSNFDELKEYNKTPGLNSTDSTKARAELNKIKGFVVLYPNRFLSQQDLTPPLGTKENLLPTRLWT